MTIKIATRGAAEKILDKYDTYLFDCDGVIWIGNELLPSVKETLELLQSKKKNLIFVSNNSTKARDQYIEKLAGLGIHGVKLEQIINSCYSTAIYINEVLQLDKAKKIWVLGQEGITKEGEKVG